MTFNPYNKEPIDVVTLISGGRITVPKNVRKELNIKDGDILGVYLETDNQGNHVAVSYRPVKIVPR